MNDSHVFGNELATSRNDEQYGLHKIREALRGLSYGQVTVIVQDGVVIQVERTERIRVRTNVSRKP